MDDLQLLQEVYGSPEPPSESVVRRQRQLLMTTIATAEPTTHRRNRRTRRRLVGLIATSTIAVAGVAAAAAVTQRDAAEAVHFACVADDVVSVMGNDGISPIDECEALWAAGAMTPGVTTVPPLVACVNDGGTVEVIKGEGPSACHESGLSGWTGPDQSDYADVGAAVRAARISLHNRYESTGNGCATEQDWRDALAPVLSDGGWDIDINRVEPNRHCFDVGYIDPASKILTLVGVPHDYSIGCDPRTGC